MTVVTGTVGGLLLLAITAIFIPSTSLVPMHTVIMPCASMHVLAIFRRWVLRGTLVPYFAGSAIGAALGAQVFIALLAAVLQGIIGSFILLLTWLPKIARMD